MKLFDTHCHIHEIVRRTTPVHDKWRDAGIADAEQVVKDALVDHVTRMLCVGTTLEDSKLAIEFAGAHENMWATIGIHPHEAKDHLDKAVQAEFVALAAQPKVVAVGECGLDYFYNHSSKADQEKLLRFQIELALRHDLPMTFHVREAYDDFWPIFESYPGLRGVLHSFTDSIENLERALAHGLYIGVNGIATFTKEPAGLEMYKAIPLNRLLLETDAPFLTPKPYRGTICMPKHVRITAEFLSDLRSEDMDEVAKASIANAVSLFHV